MAAALLEAAFEEGVVELELVTWAHGDGPVPDASLNERGLPVEDGPVAKAANDDGWARRATLACGVCAALVCLGVAVNAVLGAVSV